MNERDRERPTVWRHPAIGPTVALAGVMSGVGAVGWWSSSGRATRRLLVLGLDGHQWSTVAFGLATAVLVIGLGFWSVSVSVATSTSAEIGSAALILLSGLVLIGGGCVTFFGGAIASGHQYSEHVLRDGRSVVVERSAFLIACSVSLSQRDGIYLDTIASAPGDKGCSTDPAGDTVVDNGDGSVSIVINNWEETVRLR